MSREFKLPDLGEGITEAQIVRVLIKQGETIAEVATDRDGIDRPQGPG